MEEIQRWPIKQQAYVKAVLLVAARQTNKTNWIERLIDEDWRAAVRDGLVSDQQLQNILEQTSLPEA